jgi:hypothetical protein
MWSYAHAHLILVHDCCSATSSSFADSSTAINQKICHQNSTIWSSQDIGIIAIVIISSIINCLTTYAVEDYTPATTISDTQSRRITGPTITSSTNNSIAIFKIIIIIHTASLRSRILETSQIVEDFNNALSPSRTMT